MATAFKRAVQQQQVAWRRAHLSNQEPGLQNKLRYKHILPRRLWHLNLWSGIVAGGPKELPRYLRDNDIQAHTGTHNLCSSWVLCANLYFPFRDTEGRALVASFLRRNVSTAIRDVEAVELEYELPSKQDKPHTLLGEESGKRGSGQTSPDVAFLVTTESGKGLVLVESKFTEHWFYQCSGYRKATKGRTPNPDPQRCRNFALIASDPRGNCHLCTWGRRYWDHLRLQPGAAQVATVCPAATGAYQLFRQQALAEALARTNGWNLVVSAVAFDSRNAGIFNVVATSAGRRDLRDSWTSLFDLRSGFATFAHQEWVSWVRHTGGPTWRPWLAYIRNRYGY